MSLISPHLGVVQRRHRGDRISLIALYRFDQKVSASISTWPRWSTPSSLGFPLPLSPPAWFTAAHVISVPVVIHRASADGVAPVYFCDVGVCSEAFGPLLQASDRGFGFFAFLCFSACHSINSGQFYGSVGGMSRCIKVSAVLSLLDGRVCIRT